jgi:uncharacterized protein YdeI (YjbR/CyaY-like superfamily)
MIPVFFYHQNKFRDWLEKNHLVKKELWVGYFKVETGKSSLTWSQSVDQALCFGWIDGIRRSINSESYCIRFTPRKETSIWSARNIAKVEELSRQGLMQPAGLEAFRHRKENKSGIYSFENDRKNLPEKIENIFRENTAAWKFFTAQPPSYKKMVIHWLLSAKQETTRLSRLEKLMAESESKVRLFGKSKNANLNSMLLSNYQRLIKLAEEVFAVKSDPDQLDVSQEVIERLKKIHPATVSEFSDENGPVAWLLVIPTTSDLMNRFLAKEITEKELFNLTPTDTAYEALYLCSALVLEEYRRKGIAKQLALKAIEDIRKDHPLKCLFVWAFSKEGDLASEALSVLTELPLYKRI